MDGKFCPPALELEDGDLVFEPELVVGQAPAQPFFVETRQPGQGAPGEFARICPAGALEAGFLAREGVA